MASLAEIRARLAAADSKTSGQGTGDRAVYPHWNIDEGQSCVLRFLSDGNTKNTFFWAERAMIRLPFAGVKGEAESKQTLVQVPCVEMWGDACPVLAEVRTWFKDKNLEDMGRKYWKKRSYVFQGFVRENPLSNDEIPENPIRRFIIGPQIFTTIKSALMDPDLEELPTDLLRGLDFRISKTTKGGFADYSTSKWARKESALTAEEQAAIEKFGLFDLSEFLPKRPGEVEMRVIKEMFEASVDGQSFDMERWGQYFRPAGIAAPAASDSARVMVDGHGDVHEVVVDTPRAVPPTSSQFDEDEDDGAVVTAKSAPTVKTGASKAEDILAMIRSRQNKA